mmetsp:Transcript_9087/g.23561  ORF Transcript_9087/g.23561 Transcript_9087/m.23561 type:complete len:242 (-) Transcript_9087:151-876(-)
MQASVHYALILCGSQAQNLRIPTTHWSRTCLAYLEICCRTCDDREPAWRALSHALTGRAHCCSPLLRAATIFFAFSNVFLLALPSSKVHWWQCRHSVPLMQPKPRQKNPHGLQTPYQCAQEPADSSGCRTSQGSITTALLMLSASSAALPPRTIAGQLLYLPSEVARSSSSSSANPLMNVFLTLYSGALEKKRPCGVATWPEAVPDTGELHCEPCQDSPFNNRGERVSGDSVSGVRVDVLD